MGKQDFGLEAFETIGLFANVKLNEERVKVVRERFSIITQQVTEFETYLKSDKVDVSTAVALRDKIVEDLGSFVGDFDFTCQSMAEVSKKLGLG